VRLGPTVASCLDLLRALVLRRRKPLVVGWNITYRCNLQCSYCGFHEIRQTEMSTRRSLELISELVGLGTSFLSISGGEPLLRGDLGEIVTRSVDAGLHVVVASNGLLVSERFEALRRADEVQLSLDGPPRVHDPLRACGVHDAVLRAIECCRTAGKKVNLVCVISRRNLADLPYVLSVAKEHGVSVYFQPVDGRYLSSTCAPDDVLPDVRSYRRAVRDLIERRKRGDRTIMNSVSGLRHLQNWPQPTRIPCLAERLHCHLDPDGSIFVCDMFRDYRKHLVPTDGGVTEAFDALALPSSCRECWCATMVEFNLVGGLKPDTLLELWRRL